MAKVAGASARHRLSGIDRVPNPTGLLLCMAVAVPIWVGILALIF
ncbi:MULTISPECIES: hypothetical protein [unclassified Sphingomonas]|nr:MULTISPECIES: hypothetical protein [unclassified Sphingomonas]